MEQLPRACLLKLHQPNGWNSCPTISRAPAVRFSGLALKPATSCIRLHRKSLQNWSLCHENWRVCIHTPLCKSPTGPQSLACKICTDGAPKNICKRSSLDFTQSDYRDLIVNTLTACCLQHYTWFVRLSFKKKKILWAMRRNRPSIL